tara:strand:+ start:2658 stop:2813 length:156 start_codon:yes stop_codon:yes gene_type:complete
VGDADWVQRDVGVIRETGGDMGAGGTDAGEGAVVSFGPQKHIRRIQQANII